MDFRLYDFKDFRLYDFKDFLIGVSSKWRTYHWDVEGLTSFLELYYI